MTQTAFASPARPTDPLGFILAEALNWTSRHWLEILWGAGAAALMVLIMRAIRAWGARLCERPGGTGLRGVVARALTHTTDFFILTAAARGVLSYVDAPAALGKTVIFLFTVAAAFQGAIWMREVILGAIERRTVSDHDHGEALLNAMGLIRILVSAGVFTIALVVILDNLGVNVTGLVAGLGVGGIAIGLAAQGIFADLFAALAILFDQPFRRGDNIQFDDSSGTVEEIGLKSTRIRAFSGEQRIIANKVLLDKEILNATRRNHIRPRLPLAIDHRTPPALLSSVPNMAREVIKRHRAEPARAGFGGMSEGGVNLELEFDFPGDDWSVAHAGRDQIVIDLLNRFSEAGVRMALPGRTNYVAPLSS